MNWLDLPMRHNKKIKISLFETRLTEYLVYCKIKTPPETVERPE